MRQLCLLQQVLSFLSGFERLFATMIKRDMPNGTLNVCYPSGIEERYGDGNEPTANIRLKDKQTVRGIYNDSALKFAEMYIDGRMIIEDGQLASFLKIIKNNGVKNFAKVPAAAITFWHVVERFWRWHIARETAQHNVAHN